MLNELSGKKPEDFDQSEMEESHGVKSRPGPRATQLRGEEEVGT